jgi:hypothetical protein
MTIGILAASMLFPPAIIGLAVLECSGTYESKQFIIAIDGVRIRDVYDFAEALNAVEPGELVYLTLVSNGKRKTAASGIASVVRRCIALGFEA